MQDDPQSQRRREIEAAAFELLSEKGYRSTSMLQIAKRAHASNQTLYAWYGNKQGLFKGLVEQNGAAVRAVLQEAIDGHAAPLAALEVLGPVLLAYTASEQAITIKRAAIADVSESGVLAQALQEVGRGVVFPLIVRLMERLKASGTFILDHGPEDAAETYVALLFGEVQILQVLGSMTALADDEITYRSARAFDLTCRLYKSP